MKPFRWSPEKNQALTAARGVSFERIVVAIEGDDAYEREVGRAYEKGKLASVATKTELARLKAAARATAIKDRRVNIRLSSGDLSDIQARALEEGVPYQTLIASVLHKYVTGRLAERRLPVPPGPAPARKAKRAAST